MNLYAYLRDKFPSGIEYDFAAQLCLCIYSCDNFLFPAQVSDELTKETVSETFLLLSTAGLIRGYNPSKAEMYGAEGYPVESLKHWRTVISSIFTKEVEPDADYVKGILDGVHPDDLRKRRELAPSGEGHKPCARHAKSVQQPDKVACTHIVDKAISK